MVSLSLSSSGSGALPLGGAARVASFLLCLMLVGARPSVARQSRVVSLTAIGGPGSETLQDLYCASPTDQYLAGLFEGSASIAGLEAAPVGQAAAGLFVSKVISGLGSWIVLFEPLDVMLPLGMPRLNFAGLAGDSDGTVYLAGGTNAGIRTGSMSVSGTGPFLSAISRDGVHLWTSLSDSALVSPLDVAVLGSSAVATIGGFSGRWLFAGTEHLGQSNGHGGLDLYVAKYSSGGAELGLTVVDAAGGAFPHGLMTLRLGDLLATGETVGGVQFGSLAVPGNDGAQQGKAFNYFIGRLSAELEPEWGLRFGDQPIGLSHVAERSDGKIYWAGSLQGEVFLNGVLVLHAAEDAVRSFLALLDSDGELEWIKPIADDTIELSGLSVGPADEAVVATVLGQDFVVGAAAIPVPGRTHALIVYTASGDFAELVQIGARARSQFFQDMLPCDFSKFPVTIGSYNEPSFATPGHTLTNAGETDSYIAEVALDSSVLVQALQTPASPELQVYPNPSQGRLLVRLRLELAGRVQLELFDLIGRRVWHRVKDRVGPSDEIEIDVSGLAPGAYLVRVSAGARGAATSIVTLR
jgi:Secretion system C-terminal sorting domain